MPQGYRVYKSPDGATSAGTFSVVDMQASLDKIFAQVTITGTATLYIQASLDETNFINVTPAISTNTVWELDTAMPYYRVCVTALSSGSVTVGFGPGEGKHGEMMNVSPPIRAVGGPI